MFSNTRLTAEQKIELKNYRGMAEALGIRVVREGFDGATTIAYRQLVSTVEFALSNCSPNEHKYRRKVGEYFALRRFFDAQTVKMRDGDFYTMLDVVYKLPV